MVTQRAQMRVHALCELPRSTSKQRPRTHLCKLTHCAGYLDMRSQEPRPSSVRHALLPLSHAGSSAGTSEVLQPGWSMQGLTSWKEKKSTGRLLLAAATTMSPPLGRCALGYSLQAAMNPGHLFALTMRTNDCLNPILCLLCTDAPSGQKRTARNVWPMQTGVT